MRPEIGREIPAELGQVGRADAAEAFVQVMAGALGDPKKGERS